MAGKASGKMFAWRLTKAEGILACLLAAIMLCQFLMVTLRTAIYVDQDLTLETVITFLKEDRLYGSNPLTGFPYEQGIPSRLKILCLPTLYAVLCQWTGASPELVVWHLVPGAVLVLAYLAYVSLGRVMFPEQDYSRILFLIFVTLLFWVGDAMYGLEGFGLFHAGYQGATIRSAVLMPWLFGLCLRRKWKLAVCVILAEACIVWTLYGAGMGVAMLGIFLAILFGKKHLFGGKEGA